MSTHDTPTKENKITSATNDSSFQEGEKTISKGFVDNRPNTNNQRSIHQLANGSQQVNQLKSQQELANNSEQSQEALQLHSLANGDAPSPPPKNNTGLPDDLKTGIENLSGYSLDDVKVHRNSNKPAQIQAHAYAQGSDIHLGPGQEKHLPHEAWHVVQQKQGRVKPTMQMKGKVNINDDAGLEKEADVMGAKALQLHKTNATNNEIQSTQNQNVSQLKPLQSHVVQREFNDDEAVNWSRNKLSGLWNKLRHKPGTDPDCPNYNHVSANLELSYGGGDYTERELAEIIINSDEYKDIFRHNRLRNDLPDMNTIPQDGSEDTLRDNIIVKAIRHCVYYHATKTEFVDTIFDKGLKASKGGKGEGISSHGRAEMNENTANTYNKWSAKHIFVTRNISEANGYKNSMEENSGATCEVIRFFSTPTFTRDELLTDIDSNYGLKYKGDWTGIGLKDGRINNTAKTTILHAILEMPNEDDMDLNFTKDDIERVYRDIYCN